MQRPVAASVLLLAGTAAAQCPLRWESAGMHMGGTDTGVGQAVTWDPDGPGPLPPVLVASGDFRVVDDIRAPGLATWDGTRWTPFPAPGFRVDSLILRDGHLTAGGTNQSGPVVAEWDGSAWHTSPIGEPYNGYLWALAVYNGDLYATGDFSIAGTETYVVHQSNGVWVPVPGAFPDPDTYPGPMATHDGRLAIGGAGEVDWWDGSMIERDRSIRQQVRSLAEHNGDLYAGAVVFGGGSLVWRWTGSAWVRQETNIGPMFQVASADGFASYNGDLYVAGYFEIYGTNYRNFARWNGAGWEPVGASTGAWPIGQIGGRLFASGFTPETLLASNLAVWNGTQWGQIAAQPRIAGLNYSKPRIGAIARFGDDLWFTGSFTMADSGGAIGTTAARLHNGQWTVEQSLPPSFAARFAVEYRGDVYLGAGGSTSGPLMYRRAGSGWQPMSVTSSSGGLTGLVVWDDALIAAGRFLQAGGSATHTLLRWDGGAWTPLPDPPGEVDALTVFQGDLIAGGWIGASNTGYAARLGSNGQWVPLGGPFAGAPYAFGTFDAALTAGGEFSSVNGIPAANIARWNGQRWQPVGSGVPAIVYTVLQKDRFLLAGGRIHGYLNGSETDFPHLYAWDGAAWTDAGIGGGDETGYVSALFDGGDAVWVGGSFSTAGELPAPALARLIVPCSANCDCSTTPPILNVADFTCFLSSFAAGSPYANCDGSTHPPILNVNDFICFQQRFAAGCP